MKKSELKRILKPLITECIKEVMFEDGVLSGIITEVARGMASSQAPVPRTVPKQAQQDPVIERMKRNIFKTEQNGKLKEHKNKLMAAIGSDVYNGVNLFEGTTAVAPEGSPSQQASSMSGIAPGDAGVDISSLFGSVGHSWSAHMNEMKEEK
jgi:hypothetical protein